MKKEDLTLTKDPNPTQLAIAKDHEGLCTEFLYDADGISVYAVCQDGIVEINFNPDNLVDVTPNPRFLESMRSGL